MTTTLLWTLLSVFLVSCVSLAGIITLAINKRFLKRCLFFLVSFSTGALLANVFLHLIPESVELGDVRSSTWLILGGILLSFFLEKIIHWRHCHTVDCSEHIKPVGPLVLMADALHNIVDGILIAASYLVSIPLGISTTLAVAAHELPQEIGDFAVLVHSGFSRAKALLYNFLSALTAIIGALITLFFAGSVEGLEMYLVPIAAGNLLYIAVADLIPELHRNTGLRSIMIQFAGLAAGILLIWTINGQGHAHSHGHDDHDHEAHHEVHDEMEEHDHEHEEHEEHEDHEEML